MRSASALAAGSFLAAVRTTGIFWVLGIALRQWHGRDHAEARILKGAGGASKGFYVVVRDHDGCSAVHGARFYTHFTFAATVMCATLLYDEAG